MTLNELQILINIVLVNNNRELCTQIGEMTDLRTDLGFDSLCLAELTVRIEEKTGIDIFENGIVNSIGEILKCIHNDE